MRRGFVTTKQPLLYRVIILESLGNLCFSVLQLTTPLIDWWRKSGLIVKVTIEPFLPSL
jgi:hypothetical protein